MGFVKARLRCDFGVLLIVSCISGFYFECWGWIVCRCEN
jgi:hypothetical protein